MSHISHYREGSHGHRKQGLGLTELIINDKMHTLLSYIVVIGLTPPPPLSGVGGDYIYGYNRVGYRAYIINWDTYWLAITANAEVSLTTLSA